MRRLERMKLAAWLGAVAIMLSVLGLVLAIVNEDSMPTFGFFVLGCLSVCTALTSYRRYEQEKEKEKYEYKHL